MTENMKTKMQLPLVAIAPSDLDAVREILRKVEETPEGGLLRPTLAEGDMIVKYFPDFSMVMLKDFAKTFREMLESPTLALARALDMQKSSGAQLVQNPQPSSRIAEQTLGRPSQPVQGELSTFSPTIDRKKSFSLSRWWWLWPWAAVSKLRARCETLANMYDGDMKAMSTRIDEVTRAKVKDGLQVYSKATKFSNALEKIAAMRTPRCASIGRRMADVADEALK